MTRGVLRGTAHLSGSWRWCASVASLFLSPNGKETWFVYGGDSGYDDAKDLGVDPRIILAQPLGWNADNAPNFGVPTPLKPPFGGAETVVLMADRQKTDARALMKTALQNGVRVTPLCRAIMGWLCDAPTEPAVAEMRRSADGQIWLRLSDEAVLEPLCSYREFLDQLKIIGAALGLTDAQNQQIAGWAQMRLF